MGGFDNHVAIIGDWMPPPSPSPRSFFTAMLGDDISSRSISEHIVENKTGAFFQGHEEWTDEKDGDGAGDQLTKSDPFSEQKMGSRGGGLLERMAARAGFNAPRLNTENIRPSDLSQNGDVRSPYLTIPSGLSPTTLLESPVFLSNSQFMQVQPSPTTGKIPFGLGGYSRSSTLITDAHNKNKNFYEDINTSSFAFKPVAESSPFHFFGAASKMSSSNFPQKIFPSIEVSVQPENSRQSQSTEPSKVRSQNGSTLHLHTDLSRTSGKKDALGNTVMSEPRAVDIVGGNAEHSPPLDEPQDEDADQRGGGDAVVGGAPSDDGYNWRKYGQKQVKGSEYPRSYYKCTHPNCPVKKKVERSPEGHITEIIYKGTHNHSKPPPNRRSAIGSANPLTDIQLNIGDQNGAQIGPDGDSIWTTMQKGAPDWGHDNLEATSSASMGGEYSNEPNTVPGQNSTHFELGDAVDASSTFSNEEDEDDRGTHGSVSLGYDGEGDESDSKRRKIEAYSTEMSGAARAIREPRVVVQTTSEVDILDDGYRWRKYGQKVVKGNPNPRSYYKCTNAGCTVRKHVERASHDLKSVITTYEGKHNHDVPAARSSSHGNPGTTSNGPSQTGGALPTHLHRSEPSQVHNNMARFDRPPSFGLPERQQMGPGPGPPHGYAFGMNQPGFANLAMAGLGPNPYMGGQQRPMSEMGFMLSKGEPKMEPMSEPHLNLTNGSSSLVYNQIMSRLPLGPHI